MLGLFGNKSDYPLADLKSAQQVLNEIPKSDALSALQEIIACLESIFDHIEDIRVDQQYAVLRLFDEAAQPFVRKLTREYFALPPLSKFQENRLWTLLEKFYTFNELLHLSVLRRCLKGDRGAATIKAYLPLLVTRGIATLSGRLKFLAARYALIQPDLWAHLAEFYAHAEANGYLEENIPQSAVFSENTSVGREFALLVVWYGLNAGTTSPLNEHIAERLLVPLSKNFRSTNRVEEGSLFAFGLNQSSPPKRVYGDMTLHSSLRFVIVDNVLTQLEAMIKTLKKDIIPEEVNFLGATFDTELVSEVAKHLLNGLTFPMQTRRNPRLKINVNLNVANGFTRMLDQTDVGLNFHQGESENWHIEEISISGYRSVVPASSADRVKIGTLIGSRPENIAHWGAGIVRRMGRDEKNNLHIGVEVLSNKIIGVTLTDHKLANHEEQVALYAHRPNDTGGEAWLIMKPATFSSSRSLNMEYDDKRYLLIPLGLMERGEDYDLARFRRLEQDGSDIEE
jgi:hypothetical protein